MFFRQFNYAGSTSCSGPTCTSTPISCLISKPHFVVWLIIWRCTVKEHSWNDQTHRVCTASIEKREPFFVLLSQKTGIIGSNPIVFFYLVCPSFWATSRPPCSGSDSFKRRHVRKFVVSQSSIVSVYSCEVQFSFRQFEHRWYRNVAGTWWIYTAGVWNGGIEYQRATEESVTQSDKFTNLRDVFVREFIS